MLNIIRNKVSFLLTKLKQIRLSYITFTIIFTTISYFIFNILILDKFTKWFLIGNNIDYIGLIAFFLIGLLLVITVFILLAHKWTLKLLAIIFTIFNASSTYFIATYNVAIDKTMIENILHTDFSESLGLLTTHMLPYLLLISIISFVVIFIKIDFGHSFKYIFKSLLVAFISFGCAVILLYWQFTSIHRAANQSSKYIFYQLVPVNYMSEIIGIIQNNISPYFNSDVKHTKIIAKQKDNNNLVVVLAIGESSRQKNFSIYGYNRKITNPLLLKQKNLHILNGIARFSSTIYALPEILEKDDIKLTSITKKVGIKTFCYVNYTLYDNCKDVGEINVEDTKCTHGDSCYDEDVIPLLSKNLSSYKSGKRFIVLHMGGGSHGPSYKNRHPKEFQRFNPQCLEADIFNNCSKEELYNSYDNTILYVDYVVDKTIKTLDDSGVPYIFIYLSDHGESLMENGNIFHGMPPGISLPAEQAHVPLIIKSSIPIHIKKFTKYYQQDIFSTILDLLSIKIDILNENRVFIKNLISKKKK